MAADGEAVDTPSTEPTASAEEPEEKVTREQADEKKAAEKLQEGHEAVLDAADQERAAKAFRDILAKEKETQQTQKLVDRVLATKPAPPEAVAIIMKEFGLSRDTAQRRLREASGNVELALLRIAGIEDDDGGESVVRPVVAALQATATS